MALVTLDDIDRASRSHAILPRFDAVLESEYRQDCIEEQNKLLTISWMVGLFLYDSIIISDYFVAGGYFSFYLIGRFIVCTPICLLMLFNMGLKNRHYEIFVGLVPLTMTATLSILLMLTKGAYRADYVFGDLLLMICGCVISRPRMRHAITTVLAQYCMYQTVISTLDIVEGDSLIVASMFGLCGVVVALITAYTLEHIGRRAFLLSLRVRCLNEELKAMTLTDPLTRLGNRRCYDEAVERFWSAPVTSPRLASFILIDLDRFKSYNDSYGHSAGDCCLSTVARRIADQMRRDRDIAVRFGGEEFVVFLPETEGAEAYRIAERIRLAILDAAIPHPAIAPGAVVSASLGVATSSTSDSTPGALINCADMALYAAKQQGRNCVWPPLGSGLASSAPRPSERLPEVA